MAEIHPEHNPLLHATSAPNWMESELDYNNAISFGRTMHEYFGFTPFSQHAFNLEDAYWLTMEHYMQAKKFIGHPTKIDDIKNIKKPEEIAHYTNDPENSRFINDEWNKHKHKYMYRALYAKFIQNDSIYDQLMYTGNKFLIYDTDEDRTWGIGYDKSGKNYLGLLLCNIRTYFRAHPKPLSHSPPPDFIYDFMNLPENRIIIPKPKPLISYEEISISPFPEAIIHFGDHRKDYYYLCNDSNHGFELDGTIWLTVTHYYLTKKFAGFPNLQNTIAMLEDPIQAREFAATKREFTLTDFDCKKDSIMQRALSAKFRQQQYLSDMLLATQPRRLVFDCDKDAYWGIGPDAKGVNRLGVMLSDLRMRIQPGGILHKPLAYSDDIYFFNADTDYFEFTPYSMHRIQLDYKYWPTVSHYFQAQKFTGKPEIVTQIAACNSAQSAWDIAHDEKNIIHIPMGFQNARNEIMLKAMSAKIDQHEDVRKKLENTGNRKLLFAAQDIHWGIGKDANGKNTIGKILMEIRKGLAAAKSKELPAPMIHKPSPMALPTQTIDTPTDSRNTIYFFSEADHLFPLSSFSIISFLLNELKYKTLSHFFQSQKFKSNSAIQRSIINSMTPLAAVSIAKDKYEHIMPDFNKKRKEIMELGLQVRFNQNPSLKDLLMSTEDKNLVLNNKKDEYWGIGDGTGKNCFGKLLMKIRDQYAAIPLPIFDPKAPLPLTTLPILERHLYSATATTLSPETRGISNPFYPGIETADFAKRPMPMPRHPKSTLLVHPETVIAASYCVDTENSIIVAKNSKGDTVSTICNTSIKFPCSVCDDEESIYVLCAPKLVKINKFTNESVKEVPLQIPHSKIRVTTDGLSVINGGLESVYSFDLKN
ncbi:hypothetical protein LOD99_58 [Oopsacas minuta]|uniref:NADAR domain-containing protein n=1 Tax=Oopsacas minuta TaxID=111878 RepID=A0AAV7K9F4_9METZ|nr:hypothetical protein LOD99_58 [Oopsacas minuta]